MFTVLLRKHLKSLFYSLVLTTLRAAVSNFITEKLPIAVLFVFSFDFKGFCFYYMSKKTLGISIFFACCYKNRSCRFYFINEKKNLGITVLLVLYFARKNCALHIIGKKTFGIAVVFVYCCEVRSWCSYFSVEKTVGIAILFFLDFKSSC